MHKHRFALPAAAILLALGAVATPAGAAEGRVLGAGAADAVPGRYIVALRDGVSTSDIAARYGAEVTSTYSAALTGFAARLDERRARRLAADPAVAYVEQDRVVRVSGEQPNPPSWGTDRVDQRKLPLDAKYTYTTTASNVTAYVIDSGIAITHQDFGGRAAHGYDAIDKDNDSTDCMGHGTHVAGTVGGTAFGVAKGVKLVGIRVFDCDGGSTSTALLDGIDWVVRNVKKPAVANLSLGGPSSTSLNNATKKLIAAGITTVVAAGNSNKNACDVSPANLPEAITVGASNRSDKRWQYSNWGTCLDLFAPGQDIVSAKHDDDRGSYATSGTSMAAPQVAGVAALYLADHPDATNQQTRDAIVGASTPSVLSDIGTGSPNKLLFSRFGA